MQQWFASESKCMFVCAVQMSGAHQVVRYAHRHSGTRSEEEANIFLRRRAAAGFGLALSTHGRCNAWVHDCRGRPHGWAASHRLSLGYPDGIGIIFICTIRPCLATKQ